jgi:hypothetical protein
MEVAYSIRVAFNGCVRRAACASFVAFAAFATLALQARGAAADTSRRARLVYLRGQGTEPCPAEAELHDAVAARLGYDPFSTWAQDTLFVELGKDPQGGFLARVKLVDVESNVRGERELHARNECKDLVPTMALTISLAIDPMAGTRNGLPEDTPPSEKPVDLDAGAAHANDTNDAKNKDETLVPPATSPAATDRVIWGGGVGMLGALGGAPSANVGFALFGEGRYKWASLGVEGRIDVPASADVDPQRLAPATTGVRVSSWLAAGVLRVCGHLDGFFACGLGMVGSLRATGLSVSSPSETGALYGAAGLRGGYEVPLSTWLSIRGQLEGDAVLTRYALQIGNSEVYRYSPFAGNLGLDLVARFASFQ